MNKTELIDKLLHLGNTTKMCSSTDRHKAKELAHNLIDEYLQAINYTQCCKSDSELLKWDSTQPSFDDWLKLIGAEKMTTGDFVYRRTIVSRQWIINLYESMYNPF